MSTVTWSRLRFDGDAYLARGGQTDGRRAADD
jgi:hypothetical protein